MMDASRPRTLTRARKRHAGRRGTAQAMSPARNWARTVLGRYVRQTVRAAGAERVLARPLSFVHERWLLASRTLLPRIRLAIHPVLRARVWHARPILATPGAVADVRTERTVIPSALASVPPRNAFAPAPIVLSRPAGSELPRGAQAPRPALQLVFQRLRQPEHAIGAVSAARRGEAVAERPAVARRLAAKSRRIEQGSAEAPARVVARREAPSPSASGPDPAADWATRIADARWSDTRPGIGVAAQPAVNIAALADRVMQQIDDRLHAWQERTGF